MTRVRAWMVFAAVAPVYLVTANYGGAWANGDTLTAALASWSLGVRHALNLAGTEPYPNPLLWLVPGAHGSIVSNRFPGVVLVAIPSYVLYGARHFSPAPGSMTAALLAALGVALVWRALVDVGGLPGPAALAGAGLFAFGTAQWTVSGSELWEHSATVPLCAAVVLLVHRQCYGLAGLAAGGLILFRPHLGVVGLVLALCLSRRTVSRPAVRFVAAMVPGLAGYLAWNYAVYGHFTIVGGYGKVSQIDGYDALTPLGVGPRAFLDGIAGTLVSPERGVLVLCPILLVCAFGLRTAWRQAAPAARWAALAGLAYLGVQLWVIRYSGGDGFVGSRITLESTALAAPVLVQAARVGAGRMGRVWAWLAAGYSVGLFAAGAAVGHELPGVNLDPWSHYPLVQLAAVDPQHAVFGLSCGIVAVWVTAVFATAPEVVDLYARAVAE